MVEVDFFKMMTDGGSNPSLDVVWNLDTDIQMNRVLEYSYIYEYSLQLSIFYAGPAEALKHERYGQLFLLEESGELQDMQQ